MLTAVNYHYIRQSFINKYPSIHGLKPISFEKQLKILSNNSNFISQRQILEFIKNNKSIKEKGVVITFDDGLKEQFRNALPILIKNNIPAIFFINTSTLTEKKVLNVHKIHLLRSEIPNHKLLKLISSYVKDINSKINMREIEKNAINHYKYDNLDAAKLKYLLNFSLNFKQQKNIINKLFQEQFGNNEKKISEELYMNEDEIKSLGKLGYIGSHTHNHLPISMLSESEVLYELSESKNILENLIKSKIYSFSYPYGSHESCNTMAKNLKSCGYEFAFTMERAINKNLNNKYYLSRFDNNDMPNGKSYKFNDNYFYDKLNYSSWKFQK